jgi:Co/Zn/Cd efflux system component
MTASARHVGRLRIVFGVTLGVLLIEVVAGFKSGSLALLADAGHMLTDVAGIGLALAAIAFAARPPTPGRTYGWYRLEILAAVINAVVLFGVSAFVLVEAVRRFADPPPIESGLMFAVAVMGLAANAFSAWLLASAQRESLNMRGAYLTPKDVDLDEVRRHMEEMPGVAGVHDLHAWTITSGINVVSAHVVVTEGADTSGVLDFLSACLSGDFDIEHSTFHLESFDRRRLEEHAHE